MEAVPFQAFVGAVLVVQLVFATLLAKAPRWEGTLGQTRLGPVAEALRQPRRLNPGETAHPARSWGGFGPRL